MNKYAVTIIDYGVGNLTAFANIYRSLDIPVNVSSSQSDIQKAERLILPGVGAFDWAIKKLEDAKLRECVTDMAINKHIPILGVCVGMQMMAKSSAEGVRPGLGWFDAHVKQFPGSNLPLPHMGWNDVRVCGSNALFCEIEDPQFYFLHSFYFDADDSDIVIGASHYGKDFISAVSCNNLYGVQFHPEKSHQWGVQLLKNFSEI